MTKLAALALTLASLAHADAPRAQLNSQHQRFRVQPVDLGGYALDARIAPLAIGVGGTATLAIPAQLGVGHGPFERVYDNGATVTATASDALAIVHTHDGFDVTCKRAGTVSLAIDAAAGDRHVTDTIDIACVAPTRFTATDTMHAPARYLAGASNLAFELAWYGNLDGREVQLLGTVPLDSTDCKSPVSLTSVRDGIASYHALRATSRIVMRSGGLSLDVPVDIVDSTSWHLALDAADRHAYARAVDGDGQNLAGLVCEETSTHAGVSSTRSSCTEYRTDRYDRVCFAVLGQTVCR